MTEEVKQEGTEQEQAQPEYSPIEIKAMEMGWRPKEEFNGDEADFVDAKEFVGRQPLYEGLASTKKQVKALQTALEALKGHYTKVHETSYQKALNDLKAQKKAALKEGEVDTFYEIEEKIEEMEAEKNAFMKDQEKIQVQEPGIHPELQAWINHNPWYTSQPHMRTFADVVGSRIQLEVQAGRMTPSQALKEIEKEVRAEFPNKFRNPNKDKASTVEGSTNKTSSKSSDFEMTEQERQVMNTLVRQKALTKEEYIRDLKAAKGLK